MCGSDRQDRKHEVQVVLLASCRKDIANHLALFSFSGPENKIDLILCRSAIFKEPDSLNNKTTLSISPWDEQKDPPDAEFQQNYLTMGSEEEKSGQRETGD